MRTDLTPGQAGNQAFMPLDDFIAEVMGIFRQRPVPDEILVQRVSFQRRAEAEGRFDAAFDQINRAAGGCFSSRGLSQGRPRSDLVDGRGAPPEGT